MKGKCYLFAQCSFSNTVEDLESNDHVSTKQFYCQNLQKSFVPCYCFKYVKEKLPFPSQHIGHLDIASFDQFPHI